MRGSFRIGLKIAGTLFLVFVLIWLIYKDETVFQLKQPQGERVSFQDVELLTKELIRAGATQLTKEQLTEFFERHSTQEELNYGTYRELLLLLGHEEEELMYPDRYRDEFAMLKKDWYHSYDRLLELLGLETCIEKKEITLLGGERELTGGKELTEGAEGYPMLAADGRIYRSVSEAFLEKSYWTIEAYVHEDRLLTVYKACETIRQLSNVWIMEEEDGELQFFYEGYELLLPLDSGWGKEEKLREQVADIRFGKGRLQELILKTDKISGKLLSCTEEALEIQGFGSYELKEDCRGYQLYDELQQIQPSQLPIGYDFSDFILEDGKICAFLLTRKEEMKNVRIAIKNSETADLYHQKLALCADCTMTVCYGSYDERREKKLMPGEELVLEKGSSYLEGERVELKPDVNTGRITLLSETRAEGCPAYRGTMEIVQTKEGLVLINELLLEEYLYSVVPSEMPASYPQEALKAQAVCARTYGYRYLKEPGYQEIGAHMDDSVSFQVYNNISENVNSTKAVKDTAGMILTYEGQPIQAYYYSTSCGYGADAGVWNEEVAETMPYLKSSYIGEPEAEEDGKSEKAESYELSEEEGFMEYLLSEDKGAYEKEEPWFRWQYEVEKLDVPLFYERLYQRYRLGNGKILSYTGEKKKLEEFAQDETDDFVSAEPKQFKKIYEMRCIKRKEGGVMDELLLNTDKGIYKIVTEYNIRYILNQKGAVQRQDGSEYESAALLPSAYMFISPVYDDEKMTGYHIVGGGYGHGVGMSQNGAKAMGERKMSCQEILAFFYEGCQLQCIY